MDQKILKADERVAYALRSLYRRFGYTRYKMSKFEEYALYVHNKDFLVSDGIISFTDTNGRLLALKPDVTLSIIKNSKDIAGQVQKLYYDENVYRISKNSHTYKEIKQTGLECIGDVGVFELCEVVMLAIRSLENISDDYIFELSHVGVIESVLNDLGLDNLVKQKVIDCISKKNPDELRVVCEENALSENVFKTLSVFVSNYASIDSAVLALTSVCVGTNASKQLAEFKNIVNFIADYGLQKNVRIDFSLTNDMTYYSGVAFKGYIKNIPVSVLSGGRYDKLMENMGRTSGAVGFAVYLDTLERLDFSENEFDVDIVLIHNGNISEALKTAEKMSSDGTIVRVCATVPEGIKYRKILTENGEEIQ